MPEYAHCPEGRFKIIRTATPEDYERSGYKLTAQWMRDNGIAQIAYCNTRDNPKTVHELLDFGTYFQYSHVSFAHSFLKKQLPTKLHRKLKH